MFPVQHTMKRLYRLLVFLPVSDLAGNGLVSPYTWEFTTGAH
jgi:hypothetical protein